MTSRNRAASVRARLLNKARADGVDFQLLLTRYGLERLLYRLSVSRERDNFLLKGALLFDLWFDVPLRPTRDIDLLGFGLAEIPLLVAAFEGMCAIEVDDGMVFDAASIRADEIRKEANCAGIRLTLTGMIDGAPCPIQVDIGYGDAVTPAPESARYPVMFGDMPAPTLRVYPRYTVVAEKLEAIISLGMANSRMKDFFDLWVTSAGRRIGPRHSRAGGRGYAESPRYKKALRNTDWPERAIFEGSTQAHAMGSLYQSQSTDCRVFGANITGAAHRLDVLVP